MSEALKSKSWNVKLASNKGSILGIDVSFDGEISVFFYQSSDFVLSLSQVDIFIRSLEEAKCVSMAFSEEEFNQQRMDSINKKRKELEND